MLENSIGEREGSSLLSCIRSYCFTPVIIDFIIFNNSMNLITLHTFTISSKRGKYEK